MKGALTLLPRKDLKEGEFLTGFNTKVMIGDQELLGVASVDIRYRPCDAVIAEVVMYTVEKEITGARPTIMMAHPITGKLLEIESIQFTNGEEVEFK